MSALEDLEARQAARLVGYNLAKTKVDAALERVDDLKWQIRALDRIRVDLIAELDRQTAIAIEPLPVTIKNMFA